MKSLFRIRACSLRLGLDGMLGETGFSQKILSEYPVNLQVSQLPNFKEGIEDDGIIDYLNIHDVGVKRYFDP